MIKNRNIASDAFIDPFKIASMGSGCAHFYVANIGSDEYEWLRTRVASGFLFPASSSNSATAINAAIDACKTGRGDKIFIYGKSTITSTIDTDGRDNIHFVGVPNSDSPQGGQTRILTSGCNGLTIASNKVTWDGIRITVAGAYAGVVLGDDDSFQSSVKDTVITLNDTTGVGIDILGVRTLSKSYFANMTIEGVDGVTATAGIRGAATAWCRANIYEHLYFRNLTTAISVARSQEEFYNFVRAINCSASFNVTGTTSMIDNWSSAVAPSGTAKVSAAGTSGLAS